MNATTPVRDAAPPRTAACALLLIGVAAALRVLKLRRTIALAYRLAGPVDARRADDALVRRTAKQVVRAAAFFPARAECLEQSIVLLVLLRRRGFAAELRLGVQPMPFTAHAWVELHGRPVNEVEDFVARLAPFPSLGG